MREVCGAFCGVVTVLSMVYADPTDPKDKSRMYALVQEAAEQYRTRNGGGSIICRELLAKDGTELYRTLQQVDPTAAAEIHPNNKNRVVRALELYYAGVTKTAQNAASRRVDAMLAAGLVEEARQAYAACGPTARQAIGHKELLPYLEGSEPLETAVERLKQETRRYAKRQITWFKRRQGTVVLEPDTMDTERLIAVATAQAEDFLYGKDKGKRA